MPLSQGVVQVMSPPCLCLTEANDVMADSHSNVASEASVKITQQQDDNAPADHTHGDALQAAPVLQAKMAATHTALATVEDHVNNDETLMTSSADMDPSELKDNSTEKDPAAPVSVTMTMTATMTIRESSVDAQPPPPVLPPSHGSPTSSPPQKRKHSDPATSQHKDDSSGDAGLRHSSPGAAGGAKSKAAKDRENKEKSPIKGVCRLVQRHVHVYLLVCYQYM